MTQIVNIRSIDDPRDAIHRACQRLSEGDLVAFPTETVYLIAANPLSPSGVRKLVELQLGGRRSLLLKSSFELRDYVPKLPPDADKLSRRGWPGPLTLALDRNLVNGLFKDLNDVTRSVLTANDETVSFRCSGHSLLADVLSLVPAPLIASAERFGGETMPRSAAETTPKGARGTPSRFSTTSSSAKPRRTCAPS